MSRTKIPARKPNYLNGVAITASASRFRTYAKVQRSSRGTRPIAKRALRRIRLSNPRRVSRVREIPKAIMTCGTHSMIAYSLFRAIGHR